MSFFLSSSSVPSIAASVIPSHCEKVPIPCPSTRPGISNLSTAVLFTLRLDKNLSSDWTNCPNSQRDFS